MTAPDGYKPADAARVVSERYRLKGSDLRGRAVQTQIINVSLQGVEELQVVLHLRGFAKPLLLTSAQRRAMLQLMHGNTFDQWVDQSITLRPLRVNGEQIIEIAEAPPAKSLAAGPKMQRFNNMLAGLASADSPMNSYVAGFLILLVLGLLFTIAYLIDNPSAWHYVPGL